MMDWIRERFPFEEMRPGQGEVIAEIIGAFRDGKRFVAFEGPTGTGKSPIAYTLAQCITTSFYLTAGKLLQDQIDTDFGIDGRAPNLGKPMMVLKGRNAYPCDEDEVSIAMKDVDSVIEWPSDPGKTAADGICVFNDMTSFPQCKQRGICEYYAARASAMSSHIALMNYHSFLFNTFFTPDDWVKRDLLILDEAHNLGGVILSFVGKTITDRDMPKHLKLPKFDLIENYMEKFNSEWGDAFLKLLHDAKAAAPNAYKKDQLARRIDMFNEVRATGDPEEWVCQWKRDRTGVATVEFKPIMPGAYTERLFFQHARKVLLLSATLPGKDQLCSNLNIPPSDLHYISAKSDFELNRRPFFVVPSGRMSKQYQEQTLSQVILDVNTAVRHHQGERGVIHTHTNLIRDEIYNRCARDVRKRFLHQKDFETKADMLQHHSEQADTVIVAPAVYEGVDFKGDLARFQVICKLPFPNLGDPQVAARKRYRDGNDWYWSEVLLRLKQTYGRGMRGPDDYCVTYMLDANFMQWVDQKDFNKDFSCLGAYLAEAVQLQNHPLSEGMPKWSPPVRK